MDTKITACYTPLYGRENDILLDNPHRGFRLETYLDVATGHMLAGRDTDARKELDAYLERYAADRPRVVQVYFYLTAYRDRDLDDTAFLHMQKYFNHCRQKGICLLLRFAYVFHDNLWSQEDAVSEEQILRHIEQVQPLVEHNRDILFCLQAGFVGPWGEWSGGSPQNRRRILDYLLDHVPKDLFVMVRYVSVKNVLDPEDPRRAWVGYHDDYLTGGPHSWNSGGLPDTPAYHQLDEETAYLPVDGEMPWASDIADIDGMNLLRRLIRHHFSTLSIEHNYKESETGESLEKWKKVLINPSLVQEFGQPERKEWFQDADGNVIERSLYEYMRDFLGYHIAVTKAGFAEIGDQLHVTAELKNYGFSAPWGMRECLWVLMDENGCVLESQTACKPGDLQPGSAVISGAAFTLPTQSGLRIGLSLHDWGKGSARFANSCSFINGVNQLFIL